MFFNLKMNVERWSSNISSTGQGVARTFNVTSKVSNSKQKIFLVGDPEPRNYSVDVGIARTFERMDENHDFLPQTTAALVNRLMEPQGALRRFGTIHYVEHGLEFIGVHFYPHEEVFDELWVRSVNGSLMPDRLSFEVHGVQVEPDLDHVLWDRSARPILPILKYTLNL